MILVDTSGWIEIFTAGPLADKFLEFLGEKAEVVTPTVVIYEVYKKLKRDTSQKIADQAIAQLQQTRVIPLTPEIAVYAAELSLKHSLAMADAIVYATALQNNAILATSDKDFENLDGVKYFYKIV